MSKPKRLVLIDGNAIMHRAYHALPPLKNRSGELVNAVYGFSTMLMKVIADLKPDYLIATFDTAKPTFRQMEYLGYQAHRPKMDDELAGQFEKVGEVLKAFGIPVFTAEGFEADDVIGTIVKQAIQDKKVSIDEVIIVTGDRDIMQLVGSKVKIYLPVKGLSEAELIDKKKVQERLGVRPEQVVDYKSLAGDSSDGYPGVPGIGPKTAIELLQSYGNLEGVYRHLDQLPTNLNEKLITGKDLSILCQRLATIRADVPLSLELEKCRFILEEDVKEKVAVKFREMGFKSLVVRMGGKQKLVKEPNNSKDTTQQELF